MLQTMGNTHLELREYARLHATIQCGLNQHDNVMRNPLITTIFTQYHVSKGLKVFGEPRVAAVLKEIKQLHCRMAIDPKNFDEMTTSKKKAAVQYLMGLKQNRCEKKGRECADGRKKRKYLTKDDTNTPTVATEPLFLMCIINAMENCKVTTVYIPGSFMQADMEGETVHMKLEGKIAELLTKIDPKLYQKYVTNEKGRTVLYVELKNPYIARYRQNSCSGKI